MAKKYYWLKLKDDFFRSKKIKKLRKVSGGDTFTIIYLKMQLLSIKKSGIIEYEGTEYNFAEQLSLELDEGVEDIKLTLAFMESNNLIDSISNESYILNKVPELIGSETDAAERMRKMRNNVTPKLQNVTQRKEIEIEKEIEIDNKEYMQKQVLHEVVVNSEDKINQEKQIKKKDIDDFFEIIWKFYPVKKGKASVSEKRKRILFKHGYTVIEKCIYRYKKYVKANDWLILKNGSTFFNSGYIDYLDENYTEDEQTQDKQKNSKFVNYDQRDHDFDALERKAMKMLHNPK